MLEPICGAEGSIYDNACGTRLSFISDNGAMIDHKLWLSQPTILVLECLETFGITIQLQRNTFLTELSTIHYRSRSGKSSSSCL